jgi:AraC-like DNA-binding protein
MSALDHLPALDNQLGKPGELIAESSLLADAFSGPLLQSISDQEPYHFTGPALPFADRLQAYSSPESAIGHLGQALPISSICNTQPDAPWHFHGFHVIIGGICVGVVSQSATTLSFFEDANIQLIYCPGGIGYFQAQEDAISGACDSSGCWFKGFAWSGLSCKIRLPAGPMFYLSLVPDQAIKIARQMGGELIAQRLSSEFVHCMDESQINQSSTQAILRSLLRGLDMVDDLLCLGAHLPLRLELEQLLSRLSLLLLFPDLHRQDQVDRVLSRNQRGRDSFDDLLEFIRANLDKTLSMPMLEAYSHYSRRAIQYAFKEKLGCTVTQWIRQQRLQLARNYLQNPLPEDTVNGIALRCGYRSASLFSMEFQQRYLAKPSTVLRQSRPSDGRTFGAVQPESTAGPLP